MTSQQPRFDQLQAGALESGRLLHFPAPARPMRILYVSQYAPPEMGAPSARVSELARHWTVMGHQVTVLTGFPNHPTGKAPRAYRGKMRRLTMREERDGVSLVRTWLVTTPNGKPWQRMLNYGSFAASAAARGTLLPTPDVVIATSPQLLVGLSGWWLSRIKRRPLVLEVRDLWPESLMASGVGSAGGRFIGALDRLADFLYRRADLVVPVTEAQRDDLLRTRGLPPEKVRVIENGVETDLFRPLEEAACRRELRIPEDRFVVSYVGTLGLAHGLRTVLETAERLRARMPHALFLLVGEGAEREALVKEATRRGLYNVHFIRQQPRERMPLYIGASSVCLVTLRKSDVFKTVIPTKMLEFMSCARPIALAVDGQARQVIEEAAAGIFTPPEDAEALAQTLEQMARRPLEGLLMGQNGRRFILGRYQREALARRYADLLTELTGTAPLEQEAETAREERRAA